MKTILAAIDFSPISDLVATEAAALAGALGGKLVLVTVLVEPVYVKEFAPPQQSIARITVAQERPVKARLEAVRTRLQSSSVPTEAIILRGDAATHLLNEAEKRKAAVIVIGSHGHSALFELVLGSTTQTVLKRARQPVLVIPPKMRKRGSAKAQVTPVRRGA